MGCGRACDAVFELGAKQASCLSGYPRAESIFPATGLEVLTVQAVENPDSKIHESPPAATMNFKGVGQWAAIKNSVFQHHALPIMDGILNTET